MEKNAFSSTKETPSLPESLSLENSWTHMKLKVFEASHILKINNFSFLRQKFISPLSSGFSAAATGHRWFLDLCLDSDANLVMRLELFDFQKTISAKYKLIIYDDTKKEAKVVSKMHVFTKDSDCISEVMCSLNDIFSADKKILSNDELTVGCEVKFVSGIECIAGRNCDPEFMSSKLHYCFNNLELMFKNQKLSDVKINISGRTFEAHKAILAASSSVFLAMFESNMTEAEQNYINIEDVDEETFEEMLRFIYTGDVNNIEKVAYTLFIAADKYAIDKLKHICQNKLCESLTADNVVKVLILADLYSAVEFKERVIKFMRLQQVDVTKTEDFNLMIDKHRDLLAEVIRLCVIE